MTDSLLKLNCNSNHERVIPFKPNAKTHERKRRQRELDKQRIIAHIGINPADAPLYDEEIRFQAWIEQNRVRDGHSKP